MYDIEIKDGEKKKCPVCNATFLVTNDKEILLRNVTLLYINTVERVARVKCKQCKHYIQIDLSETDGSILNIE